MKTTKYEKARIIGARALQLSMGAPFATDITEEELKKLNYDVLEIAKLEFSKGVVPIHVKRRIPEYIAETEESKPALPIEEISSEIEKIASVDEQSAHDEAEE